MDVRLQPFDFAKVAAKAGLQTDGLPIVKGSPNPAGVEFHEVFKDALSQVSQSQIQASQMQRAVQLDQPGVSIEETMVAMQKSQINFQATLQVRNRLVQAYSDIMNMQI